MAASTVENVASLSKTQLQKLRRKQLRSQHILMKHEGIKATEQKTENIYVANGGLGNGIQRSELEDIFSPFGKITKVIMPPEKPYSFVSFQDEEGAGNAFDHLQGKQLKCPEETAVNDVTLYLSYVLRVPTLHSSCGNLPQGLIIIDEFVDVDLEKRLLESITWDNEEQAGKEAQKILKHRRVKHYGYEFRYDNNNIDKDKPLPDGIPTIYGAVIGDIMKTGHVQNRPDQITVNQYQPGQGIPPHIDTHSAFRDEIISLSLGSDVVMDFKHPKGQHIPVLLPQRSLCIMTGESRYLWTHGITPRKNDVIPAAVTTGESDDSGLTLQRRETRTSFTFRAIRHGPCTCAYPEKCDSQQNKSSDQDVGAEQSKSSLPQTDQEASSLEKEHVHEVYETIAKHFSDTRHTPWPKVVEFLNQQPDGGVFADIGCGNGKYLGVNKSLFEIGCDRSYNLVEICKDRQFEAFVCDALSVPLRSNSCDVAVSIAVIHHLSTQERRYKAISEIARILRPGGQALIYVWAMEQEMHKIKSKYLKESKLRNTDGEDNSTVVDSAEGACRTCDGGAYSASANTCNDIQTGEGCACIEDSVDGKPDKASPQAATLPIHVNRTAFVKQDMLVPWHLKDKSAKKKQGKQKKIDDTKTAEDANKDTAVAQKASIFHRFYHVFKRGELEALCGQCQDLKIVKSYYDQGNWCAVLEKLKL